MASSKTTIKVWLLKFAALALVACSGSGGPNATTTPDNTNTDTPSDILSTDMPNDSEPEIPSENNQGSNADHELVAAPVNNDPGISRIQFDIRVPAYQSNALRVEIDWLGDVEQASWVGDEYWTAVVDYPVNRGGSLNVYFYDDNGGIVLGSYTSYLGTSDLNNSTYVITSDQFDIERWDNDLDGYGNLDELLGGTDPNARAIAGSLPVLYSIPRPSNYAYTYAGGILANYSSGQEFRITTDRPYFFYEAYVPEFRDDLPYLAGDTRTESAQIDALGNGSYSYENIYRDSNTTTTERFTGTRTNTGTSVDWEGTSYRLDTSAYRGYEFDFNVSTVKVNEQTYTQLGTITGGSIGYAVGGVGIEYNFTGTPTPDSSHCRPSSGTATFNDRYDDDPFDPENDSYGPRNYNFEVNKTEADEFWSVSVFNGEMEFVESFLVQTLNVSFRCAFTDL